MTIIWVLVSILIAWVFGKWILLLLTSPLIILFSKRERRKAIELQMADNRIKEDGNTCLNQIDPQDIDPSGTKRALNILYSLFSNFLRYEIIQVGTIPSHHIRDFIYKNIFLVRKNKRSIIHYGAEIRGAYNLIIEKGAVIGDKAILDARRGFIKIGKNVQFGNSVSLWTGSHDLNDPFFRSRAGKRGPIIIEDYVWIGPDVTVLHSVTIGKGAVIAAGSIVTSDVPPFSVMAGIPAKKIGERNSNLRYDLSKYKPHIY